MKPLAIAGHHLTAAARVFNFRPGHEPYPVFDQAEPLRVVENAERRLSMK